MFINTIAFLCLVSVALCSNILSSFERCLTEVGSASLKRVPTSHSTQTVQQPDVTVKVTHHPTHQVTPAAANHTFTFTNTIYTHPLVQDPSITSTITHVSSVFTKQLVTTTITSTIYQTSVQTTTIPTPSGFLPIADTTGSIYPGGAVYSNATTSSKSSTSRSVVSTSTRKGRVFNQLNARSKPTSFPRAVNCIESILLQETKTVTKTGAAIITTLPQRTQSVTVTRTAVSTLAPQHIHGQTVYITKTVVSTATQKQMVRETTTVTVEASSTKKVYAACATNNMIGPILSNGNGITNIGNSGQSKYGTRWIAKATSAEDCCAQCMELNGCTASGYQATIFSSGICYLYYNAAKTGSGQSANPQYYLSHKGVNAATGLVVSNGPNGYLYYGGVDNLFVI